MSFILFSAFILLCTPYVLAGANLNPESEPQALAQRAYEPHGRIPQDQHQQQEDLKLLDIVLVASVDGKFHALNRNNGRPLWSMSSFPTTTSISAPSSLGPLVRTSHLHSQPLSDDSEESESESETYIIKPQTGVIYILPSPSSPRQRFPFTMSELVDMSPFTSVNDNATRVFVGLKETSLLLIELETGKIKATLNSKCPPVFDWERETNGGEDTINLDELEEEEKDKDQDEEGSQICTPTEVYIGRTDYYVSIYKIPLPGHPSSPPQNLSFSTYGPNNKDNHRPAVYRRTSDDTYIQPFPSGNVLSLRKVPEAEEDGEGGGWSTIWDQRFSVPIVAVFDVLRPSSHSRPFLLLQPHLPLSSLTPHDSWRGAGRRDTRRKRS